MRRFLSIALLVAAIASALADLASAQTPALRVPPGGDSALACSQTPDGRAYWTEYAYCDVAVKGPAAAKGLVLWSHGVSGDREQYKFAPAIVLQQFVNAGWDVIKINRNNLYERGWGTSGTKHRDDAIERVLSARAQGYKNVILAGQSYGGAISLEANARAGGVDGVLAFSPGHGSDLGSAGGGVGGLYFNLDRYLLEAAAAQKSGRVVVLVAPNDHLHPNRSAPGGFIGPRLRDALSGASRPFVVFDETGPISGQFAAWFGPCVVRFLDPAQPVAAAETVCPPPNPVPQFLLPANFNPPQPGPSGEARWLGAWQGTFGDNNRDLLTVVEKVTGTVATIIYSPGAGPKRELSMGYDRHSNGRIDGETLTVDRGVGRTVQLSLAADGESVNFEHTAPSSAPDSQRAITPACNPRRAAARCWSRFPT